MTRKVRDLPNWPPEAGGAKIHGGPNRNIAKRCDNPTNNENQE